MGDHVFLNDRGRELATRGGRVEADVTKMLTTEVPKSFILRGIEGPTFHPSELLVKFFRLFLTDI